MNDRATQDLVDRYLLHQITPDDKARLLAMMEADPVFAQYVKECEETVRILQAARNRELRSKLKIWDAGIPKPWRRKGRGLLYLFLVTAILITFWCWLNYHFSAVTLARACFNAIPENNISSSAKFYSTEAWQEGIAAFQQGNYEKANFEFISIPESDDQSMTNLVRWNILLSQLAMHGPSSQWVEDVIVISNNAPEPIRAQAKQLIHVIHSPIYIILNQSVLHKTFTAVKPKII